MAKRKRNKKAVDNHEDDIALSMVVGIQVVQALVKAIGINPDELPEDKRQELGMLMMTGTMDISAIVLNKLLKSDDNPPDTGDSPSEQST